MCFGVSIIWCSALGWAHILYWFLWCGLHSSGLSLFGPTVSLRLPGCVCQTYRISLAKCSMENSYIEGPLKIFEDDYRRMRSSNDVVVDKIVDLSSLGVVDLDTTIMPDVFSRRAFDAQETVARVLPGDFGNLVVC